MGGGDAIGRRDLTLPVDSARERPHRLPHLPHPPASRTFTTSLPVRASSQSEGLFERKHTSSHTTETMRILPALLIAIPISFMAACGPDEHAAMEDMDEMDHAAVPEMDHDEMALATLDPVHAEFMDNLRGLCGATFEGRGTYPDEADVDDHPLIGTGLRNVISECTDTMVRIELYREDGEYWHGAWVLEARPGGLHLFHDHIGDRTPEEVGDASHGYGGYADDRGTATRQYFPADEVTAQMIPAAETNVWMMDMDLDAGTFVYYLERHGEPRFRAEMELQG